MTRCGSAEICNAFEIAHPRPRSPVQAYAASIAGAILTFVAMTITLECVEETAGRWLAEVPQIPGVHAYGSSRNAAAEQALELVYRVLDDARRTGANRTDTADVFGRESERHQAVAAFESALS